MRSVKSMRRLLLAMLLPVLGLLGYGAAAAPKAPGIPVASFQEHRGAPLTDSDGHHSDLYRGGSQPATSPGIREAGGGGGDQPGGGGPLPTPFIHPTGCDKAFLKEHSCALRAHFTQPQRLALYPKHWFW